jgi:hypothetical protein
LPIRSIAFLLSTGGVEGSIIAALLATRPAHQRSLRRKTVTETQPFDPALFGDAVIDAATARLNNEPIELLIRRA